MSTPRLIAIMGPTAAGKTAVAETIADRLDAILVNADAFQMVRRLDIGTAKPENRRRYHLLDIYEPTETGSVADFIRRALPFLQSAYRRGQDVVVVGGTGLYIRALFEEFQDIGAPPDPYLRPRLNEVWRQAGVAGLHREWQSAGSPEAGRIDPQNPVRLIRAIERAAAKARPEPWRLPEFQKEKLAITVDTVLLRGRIRARIASMMQNGWLGEVATLRAEGFRASDPGFRAIGYRILWDHLDGNGNLDEAVLRIEQQTWQYAKRQVTWLRSEPGLRVRESEPDAATMESWLELFLAGGSNGQSH